MDRLSIVNEPIELPCPVCSSGRFHPRYPPRQLEKNAPLLQHGIPSIVHHAIVECLVCGVAYTRPRDLDNMLSALNQAASLRDYLNQAPGKAKMFLRQLVRLEDWLGRRGRLLDLGCAAGLFCRQAVEKGWQAVGCDSWAEAVEYGKKAWGLDLRCIGAEGWESVEGLFDAIVLWDSIEHLPRPGKILTDLRRHLKPGGILALSTPDYGSFSRRILGSRWHFFERTHLTFFSRTTLTETLEKRGYRIYECLSQKKTVSLGYIACYLAKWHPGLSRRLNAIMDKAQTAEWLVTIPAGMILCYAKSE